MSRGPTILKLADTPHVLGTLVEWFEAEWVPYYGPGGPGDAEADLLGSMNRDDLPVCLVAIAPDGAPLGTISLKAESISHPELGPWAAAFMVAPHHRGRGVGSALLAAGEEEARRLGFSRLYMSTDGASGMVARRGWQLIDTAESLRGPVGVYEVTL